MSGRLEMMIGGVGRGKLGSKQGHDGLSARTREGCDRKITTRKNIMIRYGDNFGDIV